MPGWRILLWVVLVLTAVLFFYLVRGILLPFLLSFIIAALLEPTVRKLRLRGMSRRGAVGLVVGAFFIGLTGAGVLIMPTLSKQTSNLAAKVDMLARDLSKVDERENFFVRWNPLVQAERPDRASQIDNLLAPYTATLERFGLPTTQRVIMERYVEPQRPQIAKAVQAGFHSFFGFLTNIFSQIMFIVIVPILVPLILMEFDDYRRRGPKWIPPAIRASTIAVIGDIGQVFVRYLRGIASVILLYTVAQTALMLLMGVPYALLLGPLFGALYLIPYIGTVISAIALFAIIGISNATGNFMFSMGSPWGYAAVVTIMYLIVGWIFDHLIYPQMVGNSVGLSPVISMFVIFCGGALFGLPGMLIAFPLAGSVKVILDRLIRVTSTSAEGLNLPSVPLRHRTTASG